MEVSIYTPEPSARVFQYHVNQITGRTSNEWTYYHDAELFKSARGKRIACFQIPYPWDPIIEQQINDIYDSADNILIIGSELHAKTIEFVKKFDLKKITYFLCGYLHWKMLNSEVYKFLDWFTTSTFFYKSVKPSILYQLNPYEHKPLMFDALLGRKKPHRDLAYNFIKENNMLDKGVVTYINDYRAQLTDNDSDTWRWEADGINDLGFQIKNIEFTVDTVEYYGYNMSLSQIIPINIYNETAYSLVCETNFDNQFVFLTEKTVKPILARRLFITLGNQYYLAALRRLGFRTFHGIIDESYDTIEDHTERHIAALEQLKWLCEQDQTKIIEQIKEITDHNYNLMMTNDWYNLFRQDFGDFFFPNRNRLI
jgi:hypothetical protein